MPKVSIIIPTRNEEENIAELLKQLSVHLTGKYDYEAVVVDDSTDKTAEVAEKCGARVVKGQRKGLGQAIVDGLNQSELSVVAVVMDADMSHPVSSIPDLVDPIINCGADMTFGSRYVKGGSVVGWGLKRKLISFVASVIASPLTFKRDNTSGFFALRTSILKGIKLDTCSWKIMIEVLIKANPMVIEEVPICFADRTLGKSKFNKKEVVAYLKHLVKLYLYKYKKFIKFCAVGGSGALITFAITAFLTEILGFYYLASMVFAVFVATIWNFMLNLMWTFKERKVFTEDSYEWESFYKGNPIQKWWKRSIARTVWEWMPPQEGIKILDVGCGSSPIISKYKDAVGIDLNRNKLAFMSQKLPQQSFNFELDGYHGFDGILCIELLEHLAEPFEMIMQLSAKVKKGGKVIFATPDYKRFIWSLAERFTPYKEDHCTKLDKKELERLCKSTGLYPVKHKYIATCDLIEMFEKR